MSWDYVPGKNAEGYPDPTAAAALSNVQRSQRGTSGSLAQFEYIIGASDGIRRRKSSRGVSISCVPAWRMIHSSQPL